MFGVFGAMNIFAQVDTCNVEFVFDVNPESRTVKFLNDSLSTVLTYHWDFGDGSVSSQIEPVHAYQEEGAYNVCLTITTINGCQSTFCDSVLITTAVAQQYGLSGHVYTNYSCLPHGFALLADDQSETNQFMAVAPVIDGLYSFTNLNASMYYVYIIPYFDLSQVYFPFYLPTYSGNAIRWQNAHPVGVYGPGVTCNIQLESFNSILNGAQHIRGKVMLDQMASYENEIFMLDWATNTPLNISGSQAINIPVLLYNEQGIPVKATLTDTTGEFSFDNLPFGKYFISPEKAGFESLMMPVNLIYSGDNDNYYMFGLGNQVFTNNEQTEIVFRQTKVFPVPATDFLNIESENIINIELYNSIGNKIEITITKTDQRFTLPITHLSSGIYLLKLTDENKQVLVVTVVIE